MKKRFIIACFLITSIIFAIGYSTFAEVPQKMIARLIVDGVANFIKYGLIDDTPVACLNRELPVWYDYAWHWMSITKYFEDVNDNRWIAVSTWGERRSIDFSYYYNSTLASGGGFVYFN